MSKQTDLINVTDAITVSGSNVGIGTSSPDFKLQASGSNTQIGIESTTTNQNASLYYTANGANQWEVGVNITAGASYEIYDRVNNSSRFVVNHSGNVGIGTSSPGMTLDVDGSSGSNDIVRFSGPNSGGITFRNSTSNELVMHTATSDALIFGTNGNNERMRIDASGIVMVATTDTNPHTFTTGSGLSINSAAMLNVAKQAAVVQILNRTGNSDGVIQEYKKDGTTVGSIGVAQSGDRTYFSGGSYGVASDTSEATIMPCGTTGTGNDGVVSLGKSDARFKDAYLSGGVYLGGTGSANKLDDVEYGTYSIADASSGNLTFTVRYAAYKKVGHLVHVEFDFDYPSNTNGANAQLTIPFTPNVTYFSGIVGWSNNAVPIKIHGAASGAYLIDCGNSGAGNTHLTNANLSAKRLIGSFTFSAT